MSSEACGYGLSHRNNGNLSFDHSPRGGRAPARLHLVGGYYLLFEFMVSFGERIPDMPLYALLLIPGPLVAVCVANNQHGGKAGAASAR